MISKIQFLMYWFMGIAAWLSQTFNLFFLFGHHDMTVCCRCYINRHKFRWVIWYYWWNFFFFWEEDHCKSSFKRDVEFAKMILEEKRKLYV